MKMNNRLKQCTKNLGLAGLIGLSSLGSGCITTDTYRNGNGEILGSKTRIDGGGLFGFIGAVAEDMNRPQTVNNEPMIVHANVRPEHVTIVNPNQPSLELIMCNYFDESGKIDGRKNKYSKEEKIYFVARAHGNNPFEYNIRVELVNPDNQKFAVGELQIPSRPRGYVGMQAVHLDAKELNPGIYHVSWYLNGSFLYTGTFSVIDGIDKKNKEGE